MIIKANLRLKREGLYRSSFVMFQYKCYMVRMVRKHRISADETYRVCLTKKPVHLRVENTKIDAYATSYLKSDNKGEPKKKPPFRFFVYFLQLLILEREDLSLSNFVMFQYKWYMARVVRKHQILADEKYRDCLTKKSSTLACGKY